MGTPVAFPKDFSNRWASVEREDIIDPLFTESSSRVTASGFTDTTVKQSKNKKPSVIVEESDEDELSDYFDEELRQSKKNLEKLDYLTEKLNRLNLKKDRRGRVTDKTVKGLMEINDEIRNVKENLTLKDREEAKWEREKEERYVTLDDFKQFTSRIESSIHPKDSASVFEPVSKIGQPSSREISPIMSMRNVGISGSVVGGYLQNSEQKMEELDSYVSIMPVAGLPIVFTNERLNFLCHLHNPLYKLLSEDDGTYPALNSMSRILDNKQNWNVDPATMLLGQVLDKTIDFRKATVKSNPFELPILEPTMILTEKIVHMCFDQLYKEFEREWFNTFKTVTVPAFSSKYEVRKFKTRKMSSSSSGNMSGSSIGSRTASRRGSKDSVVGRSSFFGL